jgi:hypothetical protein
MKEMIKKYVPMFVSIVSKTSKELLSRVDSSVVNYFLFSFKSEIILKNIIQLKKLKTSIEVCKEDKSKFPITKNFSFFCPPQTRPFPLWSIYEDYTLGALIIEEGYQRWNKLMNSEKWRDYHE